uniref:Methyltransferase domain-containing protein n=1 Tax=candidate division CPR3 bacterium TaxID=2268181 RepID=A0A7V3N4R6_UNCC3
MDNKISQGENYWKNRPLIDKKHSDWREKDGNWIDAYWNSRLHPHRALIMKELKELVPFHSVLEVGCNCGPNLWNIKQEYPGVRVFGIDINKYCILKAIKYLPEGNFSLGEVDKIPFPDKSFDILLTDAVLIYVGPKKIKKVIKEFIRVTKKAMIFVEWKGNSKLGEVQYSHWARDYSALLKDFGLTCKLIKIPKEIWSSPNWAELGYIFVCPIA